MMERRRPPLRFERLRFLASLAAAGVAHLLLVLMGALSPSSPSRADVPPDALLQLTEEPSAEAAFLAPDRQQFADDEPTQLVRSLPPAHPYVALRRPGPVAAHALSDTRFARRTAYRLDGAPALSHRELPRASSDGVEPSASNGALTPAASLETETAARKARLIAEANPCGSFFPSAAAGDLGLVTLELQVTPSGTASTPRILSESPGGQGFAEAARLCASRLRFVPALDAASQPISATSVVRLRFVR